MGRRSWEGVMDRIQFWIFLGLGVVFGILFGVMKDDSESEPLTRRAAFNIAGDQPRFDMRERLTSPKITPSPESESQPETSVAGLTANKAEEKKPATDAAKKATEAKKKQDNKKKKKKKKSSTKPGESPGSNDTSAGNTKDDSDSDTDSGGGGISSGDSTGGTFIGGAFPDPDAIPQTLEEWEVYLLGQPNFRRTTRFIKFYQTGIVKPEIFYPIISSMLEDSREKMRGLGIMALGVTPSVKSFTYLADFLNDSRPTTKLRDQINVYLRMYTQIQHVRILANALTLADSNAVSMEALRLLQVAAESHLRNAAPLDPQEQGEGQPRPPIATRVTSTFDIFVPLLNRLTETSPDANVRQSASDTLSNLQSLLNRVAST